MHVADKEIHCEEATASLDTIEGVHRWESLMGVCIVQEVSVLIDGKN